MTTDSCVQAFLQGWISHFGMPLHVTSDRGVQFTSQLWTALSQRLGIHLHHTTAYHPQSNGLVERLHRHLKASLIARLKGSTWMDELPWVLLGIRTAPKEDLGVSVAELVYGGPLTLLGEFVVPGVETQENPTDLLPHLRSVVRSFRPVTPAIHQFGTPPTPTNLQNSKFVFICCDGHRPPLQPPYEGPFHLLRAGPKYCLVDLGNRHDCVSVDHLKPAHTDPDVPVTTAQAPRRGCPPTTHQFFATPRSWQLAFRIPATTASHHASSAEAIAVVKAVNSILATFNTCSAAATNLPGSEGGLCGG